MPCSILRSRIARIGALTVVLLVAMASQAFADSASISVTNTAGQSDPAAEMPRVFTVSGDTTAPEHVYIKYRNPGGAPCASTADTDTGTWFENYQYGWEAPEANGSFSFSHAGTWNEAGTFVFCIWIAKSGETIVPTPITQTITFRSPTGTITATVNPLTPRPGERATITITGSSEAAESVYAKIRPAGGAPCAASYEADSGQSLIDGWDEDNVNGSFSLQATTTQETAGTYLICLWLANSQTSTSPIAGPQPETFTVASPPPPPPPPPPPAPPSCVVPRFNLHMRLATVEQQIRAAHCRVGRIRHTASWRYRRGAVIRLSPAPTARLSSGAWVQIVVSSGRPRRHR